ncbi:MAG: hypothetical protein QXU40_02310 [Candidatus Pacearchaeota archaeon]
MANFYALTNREIHFQPNVTGFIKVIGIRKSEEVSSDDDKVLFADDYPLIYVYKVLEVLCKEPISGIFAKKYRDHVIEARRLMTKQSRFGRTFPMDM